MSGTDPRDDVPDSAAERAGIVDEQDAVLVAIEENEELDDDPMAGEAQTG
jgi:hypothetical protein